jgi:hypothetical protein
MADLEINNADWGLRSDDMDDAGATKLVQRIADAFHINGGVWLDAQLTHDKALGRSHLRWFPAATTTVSVTFDGETPSSLRALAWPDGTSEQ